MENDLLVLNLLQEVLGECHKTARNNYAFFCPNKCHPTKHKLEINLTTHQFQCWICSGEDKGFKGKRLIDLFYKAKISQQKIKELYSLTTSSSPPVNIPPTNTTILQLPKEFKSLLDIKTTDIIGRHALSYLKRRKVTKEDIIKYNIGYCEYGKYSKRVIIPTYDKEGKLNYFISRAYEKDEYFKYKNPSYSRDIIPNEHLINWNLPIILCEGLFDALAIKRNVIPLLGKNIQKSLMKKLVTSKVSKIYIALDKDAIKQALQFCETLMNEGKEVYLVEMQDKDPSDLGFEKFTNLIQQTFPLTYRNLIERKLNI